MSAPEPMRIFLDANVLFSASRAGSHILRLLCVAKERGHTLVSCELAIEEASRNIQLKRPAWSEGLETVLGMIERVASVRFDLPVELDDRDVPILCAAIRGRCEVLATGDRRGFGHLFDRTVQGVRNVSLLRLGEIVLGREHGGRS